MSKSVSLGGGLQLVSNEVKVKVKKIISTAKIPQYQTSGAAGFDLASVISTTIMPGETALVGTGLSFEIPEGYEMQVRPRSGVSAKTNVRVANSPGTIDSDFRGEVKVILHNHGPQPFKIEEGDRIAQGLIAPVYKAIFEEAEELSQSDRGVGGFGSSGK